MKSLQSTGTVTRMADRSQVGHAAAEPALFGEHADRRGSTCLVVGGECSRVGDLGKHPLARAGPFDLRDDRDTFRPEVGHRVESRALAMGEPLELVQADDGLALGKVDADAREDLVKDRHRQLSPRPMACMTLPTTAETARIPTPIQKTR